MGSSQPLADVWIERSITKKKNNSKQQWAVLHLLEDLNSLQTKNATQNPENAKRKAQREKHQ